MHYTIVCLQEANGDLNLHINASGNKYYVSMYSRTTKELSNKKFDDLDSAFNRFTEISEYIVKSYYTESEKRERLMR